MMRSMLVRILPRRLLRLAGDERGVSAVEFAMLLPLMLTLYLGGLEVSQAISIDRKVTLTARTVADLVSQVSNVTNADMNNVLNASTAIFAPYSSSSAAVTVSLVEIDASGDAKIKWSDTLNGTARAVGSSVTLPSALAIPDTALVWGEVTYDYQPTIGYVITGTMTLKDRTYMRPRLSTTITRTAT